MTLETDRSPKAILAEVDAHPRGAELAKLLHALAVSAYDERRTTLEQGCDEAADQLGVDEAAADTSFGNVLSALRKKGRASGPERTLLGVLIARGISLSPPKTPEAEASVAELCAWLSAHTVVDPLSMLELALGERALAIFVALAELVRAHDAGREDALDRGAALLATRTLALSAIEGAADARKSLLTSLKDPLLRSLLEQPEPAEKTAPSVPAFAAEETLPPRSLAWTLVLTVTLLLPVVALAKLFARFALRLRQPAEVAFGKDGIWVRSRLELLGKTLRQREVFIAQAGLSRAAREVRFPQLSTYVGIGALLCGSYLGLSLVLDGYRGRSPEFLGLGLLILLLALAIDYALSLIPSRDPSRCRIMLEPRRGRVVVLRDVDRKIADEALRTLSR